MQYTFCFPGCNTQMCFLLVDAICCFYFFAERNIFFLFPGDEQRWLLFVASIGLVISSSANLIIIGVAGRMVCVCERERERERQRERYMRMVCVCERQRAKEKI